MEISLDQRFMARALDLARETVALASPNPQVGCVLVRDGAIVGEGAHMYERRDHAEIVALKAAGARARGASAYVTLEPCTHHGRTGPCADALIAAGIARCVVATLDANPVVSGHGVQRMRAHGIDVQVGLCEREARKINDAFAWTITQHRPFVTLKAALSADGMLAPPPGERTAGSPHWLTGPGAREQVQRIRHASDALVTGVGTILADDPTLTDRTGLPRRRPLLRVVLDSSLRTPPEAKLIQSAANDVLLVTSEAAPEDRAHALRAAGVEVLRTPGHPSVDLAAVLDALKQRGHTSVLLEAGAGLNAAFLAQHLVQRAVLFYAPVELGRGAVPFSARGPSSFELQGRLQQIERTTFGPDVCVSGLLADPWAAVPSRAQDAR